MCHSLSLGPRILPALFLAFVAAAWPQELPAQTQARAKVCVALVSNATTTSLFVERNDGAPDEELNWKQGDRSSDGFAYHQRSRTTPYAGKLR